MCIKRSAPRHLRLKDRPLDHFHIEEACYATASNRREFIFPLFKLSDDGKRFMQELEASDVAYDRVLLPADPADVVQRFLDEIQAGTIKGKLPGCGRSEFSDLYPEINAAEDAHTFANSAHSPRQRRLAAGVCQCRRRRGPLLLHLSSVLHVRCFAPVPVRTSALSFRTGSARPPSAAARPPSAAARPPRVGDGRPGPTGGFVRGYERNLRCGLQWTKIMIRMIRDRLCADLKKPYKKGFPVEHFGPDLRGQM